MEEFKQLINREVKKLFLIVWPPFGESNKKDIDISIGFVFNENSNQIYNVSTSRDDMWSPCLSIHEKPKTVYAWSSYYSRMDSWMNSNTNSDIMIEYYDVTEADVFRNIVSQKVRSIEIIKLKKHTEPFGVKIIFEKDFVQSTSISCGNTIETSLFNQNQNILNFKRIGKVEYKKLI